MPGSNLPSVRALYDHRVANGTVQLDRAQRALAERYDHLISELCAADNRESAKGGALGWLFAKRAKPQSVRGLYVQGSVGRGKTMLMDWFYELVPLKAKRRDHFFAFMQSVHDGINAHRKAFKAGETKEEDPIPPVARTIAAKAKLICFDEFHVLDIADAMILMRLFTALFSEGVVLVATSNVLPDDLYMDGLNRQLFLPFITLLKAHCDVETLDAAKDFRRDRLAHVGAYQMPLGPQADAAMDEAWKLATAGEKIASLDLMVRGHTVEIPSASKSAARFTFNELCAKPLGAADYIELADRFGTIFIDHVPTLDYAKRNEAKRFIILIDVLYDNGNRLFLSAERGPDDIYQVPQGLKVGEFTRASSRLVQMTSVDWLEAWDRRRAGMAA